MSEKMMLKALKLNNIMGFGAEEGEVEFEFGQINFIRGSNGVGKTRLLNIIRFILADKLVTAWIRTDNEGESEILANFSSGQKETIKINEAGNADRKFFDDQGLPEVKADFMRLLSPIMLDTERFFNEKEWAYRIQTILSVIKAKITKQDWIAKVGNELLPLIKFDDMPLIQLKDAEKYYFDKRKAANSVRIEFEKTCNQLKNALPNKEILEIPFDKKLKEAQEAIETMIQKKNDEIQKRSSQVFELIIEERETIKVLEAQLLREKEKLDELNIKQSNISDQVKQEFEPKLLQLRQIKNDIEADKEIADKAVFQFEQYDETIDKLKEYETTHLKYDSLVKTTRDWYKEIASQIKIPGIEIGDKDLNVDGRPWHVTNQGRQVDIFMQIASLLSPDFPLILIDRFESIGEEIRKRLLPKLKEKKFQVILAEHIKAKNVPLTIEK